MTGPEAPSRDAGATRGDAQAGSKAARMEALARREGFALDQDAMVTDLLSNAGEASDLPDSLYILLSEVCSCLYHLEADAPRTDDDPG
ncbi:MAG: hypothetical protein KDI09_18550 [Halioglobus sp.]|nr:hypothetical protein [Halioglobus sp.]